MELFITNGSGTNLLITGLLVIIYHRNAAHFSAVVPSLVAALREISSHYIIHG
jgi:hypothetical protein